MTFRKADEEEHKAEKQLIEFAEIHLAANRILLTKSAKSHFAADVGYHKPCYDNFRSPAWRRESGLDDHNNAMVTDGMDELFNLIEYTIIVKKEISTLASYGNLALKNKIKERFNEKVYFCKPNHSTSTDTTEYVIPAGTDIIPEAIHSITTGEGITSCLQLKSIARSISEEIHPRN